MNTYSELVCRFRAQGGLKQRYFATPLYFFRIPTGRLCGDYGTELADRNAAWEELTAVCGNMVGSVTRTLKEELRLANGAFGRVQKSGFSDPRRRGNLEEVRLYPLVVSFVWPNQTLPKQPQRSEMVTA